MGTKTFARMGAVFMAVALSLTISPTVSFASDATNAGTSGSGNVSATQVESQQAAHVQQSSSSTPAASQVLDAPADQKENATQQGAAEPTGDVPMDASADQNAVADQQGAAEPTSNASTQTSESQNAVADEQDAAQQDTSDSASSASPNSEASSSPQPAASSISVMSDPESKYLLIDPNGDGDFSDSFVTPVKFQNPWQTCWAFGNIAAAETSILTEYGYTYNEWNLDLSERHLAWFTYTPVAEGDIDGQDGEGMILIDPTQSKMQGGIPAYVVSGFSTGIGPVLEEDAPYRNNENIIFYAPDGTPICYSEDGDWSLPYDIKYEQYFILDHGFTLPLTVVEPSASDPDKRGSVNWDVVNTWKEQLKAGRGICIGYHADTSAPGEVESGEYLNLDTWAQYTYRDENGNLPVRNHEVCIVGWDDDYPASNFNAGHQPAGNGAWLAKNSWGADGNTFPNKSSWGADLDGNGTRDGYFWLSYYDQSISAANSFDFGTDEHALEITDASEYYIDGYDRLPGEARNVLTVSGSVKMANVFTARCDEMINSVSFSFDSPGSAIKYWIYVLNDGANNPEDGQLVATKTASYEFAGFHREYLDSSDYVNGQRTVLKDGQRYSVIAEVMVNGADQFIDKIAYTKKFIERFYPESLRFYYEHAVVNPGESFVYWGGEWSDLTNEASFIIDILMRAQGIEGTGYIELDNFPVRAYLVAVPTPEPTPEPPAAAAGAGTASQASYSLVPVAYASTTGSDTLPATGDSAPFELPIALIAVACAAIAVSVKERHCA